MACSFVVRGLETVNRKEGWEEILPRNKSRQEWPQMDCNPIAPQQSLLLDFGEKRTKTNIYLAFTVYLVPAVSKFIDYSHLCETDVIPILQVGKLG